MKHSTSEDLDFTRSEVSKNGQSDGLHLALIVIGGTIGFSVFIVAAQIGGSLGYAKAAAAFALGSFCLGLMGALTSYVGARTRLSTYLLTFHAFGRSGSKLVNLALSLSLLGWYGVICNFLGQAGQHLFEEFTGVRLPTSLLVIIASGLMITVTLRGFTGIDRLALYLVPVMVLFLFYSAYRSTSGGLATPNGLTDAFSFSTAVSAVIGSYIAGVVIQPDYSRFAKSRTGAVWGVFIALGIVFPLVQFLSSVPSLAAGNPDLLVVMATLGLSLPAFFLLALGAWSSNVLCLYSSGLSIATLVQNVPLRRIIAGIGILGTALAFVPAQDYLVQFLVLLGVLIPPISAIYLLDAFVARRFDYPESDHASSAFHWPALGAWVAGVLFGFLSHLQIFQLTSIASVDSLLASALFYLIQIGYQRGWYVVPTSKSID
ncbi:MAG: cytosine permease [Pseudomonadota bacterium]